MVTNKNNVTTINKLILKNCDSILSDFVDNLVKIYLTTYNDVLTDLNVDANSLAQPSFFIEEYKYRLETFDYLNILGNAFIKIKIPDEVSFDFSGRLQFLLLLSNGVIGTYYELSKKDYNELLLRRDLSKKILDILYNLPGILSEESSEDLDFYLLDANYNMHDIFQNILKKTLVIFPFSNTEPIDFFSASVDYYNKHKDSLTAKIVEQAILDFKRGA